MVIFVLVEVVTINIEVIVTVGKVVLVMVDWVYEVNKIYEDKVIINHSVDKINIVDIKIKLVENVKDKID